MKLPIVATVLEAYRILFANFGCFVRWVTIPVIVDLIFSLLARRYLPETGAGEGGAYLQFAKFAELLLPWLAAIPATTAWHRLVILGRNHPEARLRYSVRREELTFLVKDTVLSAIFLVAMAACGVVIFLVYRIFSVTLGQSLPFDAVFYLVVMAASFAVIVRYLFVLPAAAIAYPMTFTESHEILASNGWRLYAIYALACVPGIFFDCWIKYLFFGKILLLEEPYPIESIILSEIVYALFFTITISVLAISFGKLARRAIFLRVASAPKLDQDT